MKWFMYGKICRLMWANQANYVKDGKYLLLKHIILYYCFDSFCDTIIFWIWSDEIAKRNRKAYEKWNNSDSTNDLSNLPRFDNEDIKTLQIVAHKR